MRNWNGLLFLGGMPGGIGPDSPSGNFDVWLHEMHKDKVDAVVCLSPKEQLQTWSPEYYRWRRHQSAAKSRTAQMMIFDIPIDDMRAPEPFVAPQFWRTASEIADRCRDGKKTFIHCKAGIGRTGMFAAAVLLCMGYSYEQASQEIKDAGSLPETEEQIKFLKKGPTSR